MAYEVKFALKGVQLGSGRAKSDLATRCEVVYDSRVCLDGRAEK